MSKILICNNNAEYELLKGGLTDGMEDPIRNPHVAVSVDIRSPSKVKSQPLMAMTFEKRQWLVSRDIFRGITVVICSAATRLDSVPDCSKEVCPLIEEEKSDMLAEVVHLNS